MTFRVNDAFVKDRMLAGVTHDLRNRVNAVRQLGGRLSLESSPAEGTTCAFTLPAAARHDPPARAQRQRSDR